MSWLARTIANSIRFDEDDYGDKKEIGGQNSVETRNSNHSNVNADDMKSRTQTESDSQSSSPSSTQKARGVKDDLSELSKTITRQLWGVASLLAPPPDQTNRQSQISDPNSSEKSEPSATLSDYKPSDEDVISGIRSDLVEISGRLKSGISKLSANKTMWEITKIASNLLKFVPEEERPLKDYDLDDVIGLTEEVVAFARNIALHPETWLDFPLPGDAESNDFELSDIQQEHALAVERLAPRLAALRMEICPGYMSEGSFWKVYFVLLHPKLNKEDAQLLSTPEIAEARAKLTQELNDKGKQKQELDLSAADNVPSKGISNEWPQQNIMLPTSVEPEPKSLQMPATELAPSTMGLDLEIEKHPVQSTEVQNVDKHVVEEVPGNLTKHQNLSCASSCVDWSEKFDEDEWLRDENSDTVISGIAIPIVDDDVSFSDLEDDGDAHLSHKKVTSGSDSSTKDSRDWVQLSERSTEFGKDTSPLKINFVGSRNSEAKETSDWLSDDDIDVV